MFVIKSQIFDENVSSILKGERDFTINLSHLKFIPYHEMLNVNWLLKYWRNASSPSSVKRPLFPFGAATCSLRHPIYLALNTPYSAQLSSFVSTGRRHIQERERESFPLLSTMETVQTWQAFNQPSSKDKCLIRQVPGVGRVYLGLGKSILRPSLRSLLSLFAPLHGALSPELLRNTDMVDGNGYGNRSRRLTS